MAELPSDDENELNFSDYEADSDDDKGRRTTTSVIAHKSMKAVDISDAESDNEGAAVAQDIEFESISPPADLAKNNENTKKETTESTENDDEKSFEPISPVSDQGDFEAISPPDSPPPEALSESKKSSFENISDDEDEEMSKKPDELPEGKFSPQESEHDLNFNDESSNDSGYQIIPKKTDVETTEKTEKKIDNDIDAPVPSPFSDIGDGDDMGDNNDGQIISDILQHTDATEQQFNQINNGAKKMPKDMTENTGGKKMPTDMTENTGAKKMPTDLTEKDEEEGNIS